MKDKYEILNIMVDIMDVYKRRLRWYSSSKGTIEGWVYRLALYDIDSVYGKDNPETIISDLDFSIADKNPRSHMMEELRNMLMDNEEVYNYVTPILTMGELVE